MLRWIYVPPQSEHKESILEQKPLKMFIPHRGAPTEDSWVTALAATLQFPLEFY